jgi:hypothetical protein
MPKTLVERARELLRRVRAMFLRDSYEVYPATAPWPPGVDCRLLRLTKDGGIWQLRPGASLPPRVYLRLSSEARARASRQSANPCVN